MDPQQLAMMQALMQRLKPEAFGGVPLGGAPASMTAAQMGGVPVNAPMPNNPMGGPQPEGLQHQQWTPLDMYPLPEGWVPPGMNLPRRPPPPADPIKRRTEPETRQIPARRGQVI